MTLKEQFIEAFKSGKRFDIKNAEQIADDYAIGFGQWISYLREDNLPKLGLYEFDKQYGNKTFKELLEIYKKEKGL